MKQVTNRKTGREYYISDSEWQNLIDLGLDGKYKNIQTIEPIRKMVPIPAIEIKKTTNKKNND